VSVFPFCLLPRARAAQYYQVKYVIVLPHPITSLEDAALSDDRLQEIEIPEGVHDAEQAIEVFRTWIADGALHVTFNPDTFGPEIGEWGRLMSDCVQHIAAGIAMNGIVERQEALKAITTAFDRGMKEAMSEASHVRAGKIKRGTKH